MRRWSKFIVIGVMCMAQTFPYYLVNSTAPTIFRSEGVRLEDFWAFSLLTIPAWAKFLWAPYVDAVGWKRFGLRKSWIAVCTALGAASLFLLLPFSPSANTLAPIIAVLFIHMLIMSTQDIAVDAYTLENLEPRERGIGASVKVVFEGIGEALALAGLMFIFTRVVWGGAENGWAPMIVAAAALLVMFTIPVLIRREPPLSEDIQKRRAAGDRPRIIKFLKRKDSQYISFLLLVGGFLNFMLTPLIGPLLVDKGFELLEVGIVLGAAVPIAAPLGAAASGALITAFGLRWMLAAVAVFGGFAFTCFILAVTAGFQPPPFLEPLSTSVNSLAPDWSAGPRALFAILVLIPVASTVAALHMIFTVSRMGWASRTQAGTDFTLHGAVYNIGRTVTVAVSPFIAAALGWAGFLIVMATLIISVLVFYLYIMAHLDALCDRRRIREGELHAPS